MAHSPHQKCSDQCDASEVEQAEFKALRGVEWSHSDDAIIGWRARKLQIAVHGQPPVRRKRSKITRQGNVPLYACGVIAKAVDGEVHRCPRYPMTIAEVARLHPDDGPWGGEFRRQVSLAARAICHEIYGKLPVAKRHRQTYGGVSRVMFPYGVLETAYRRVRARGIAFLTPREIRDREDRRRRGAGGDEARVQLRASGLPNVTEGSR